MTINLEILEYSAVFRYPQQEVHVVQELDCLLDEDEARRCGSARYLVGLQDLVARYPWFIDGHAHLGFALLEQDKPKRALEACLHGIALGEAAIPSDYHGVIEWSSLENRPFLRAVEGAIFCYRRLGQRRKALALMERILAWNPNDNQGIRYLVGSEYLRLGKVNEACIVFNTEAAQYPPYRYELALLQLCEGNHEAAATSLRHGFVENGYIAEILCGIPNPMPLAIWRGSNFAEPELAHDYILQYGDLWHRTPGAVAFLQWLHTHPKVMAERAAIFECKEALRWEHDVECRRRIIDKKEALARKIDNCLSAEIIIERADRQGRVDLPWRHPHLRP